MKQEPALRELVEKLLEANQRVNLTAIREPETAWTKHVQDSLQGLQTGVFFDGARVIDVGCGAGFPGLPLALERRDLRLCFLEATGKKCAFIETMTAHFDLQAKVVNARAEDAGRDSKLRANFDVATARALGSFAEVAELCLPFLKIGGFMVLWRGKEAETEAQKGEEALDELGGLLRDVTAYELPGHETQYHLIVVEKVNATPRIYPRSVGIPKRKPLG